MRFPNRHQRSILLSVLLLITLTSSCASATANSTQPVTTSVVASVTSPVVSNTPTLIPSPTIETVSVPTNQLPIDVSLEKECIPIEDKMPDDLVLSGVWVRGAGKPYLENMDEHTKYEIPLKGGSIVSTYSADFAISPDGKRLAYIDSYLDIDLYLDPTFGFQRRILRTQKRTLRIINSSGHSLSMDFWTVNWQWIIGWVDDQNLALSVSNSVSNNEVIILNPFTGDWKKFTPPEWVKLDDSSIWSLPYSPALERFWDSDHQHLILKDIKTGDTVWESDEGGGFPSWSRDGSTLAVVSASSIDIISKDKQTIEFDIRKLGLDPSGNTALSPDSQNLFFTTDTPEKFVILDMNKSKIYKLCTNEYELTYRNRPFWSPDNRFIVLGVYDAKSYPVYNSFDVLIDTEQMSAYKLITRRYQARLAWLAKS